MIQVYTGNGKGKTTAAIGMAVRAAGAGMRVCLIQFCKGRRYSELNCLKEIKNVTVLRFGRTCFIRRTPSAEDCALARKGLTQAKKTIQSRKYKLIILDEINIACHLGLIKPSDIIELISITRPNQELILTGRYAHPKILSCADLISEIKEKKHYYQKGIKARKGIEH